MNPKTPVHRRVSVKSFAKVNLALDVLKKEKTYHRLLTVFYQIGLHDTIIFQTQNNPDIHLICDNPQVPTNQTNTILQAANLLKKYAADKPELRQRITGLRIRLIKRIPVASGLGGGSSNAAVTLATLNRLWKLRIPAKKLHGLAATIGMDVPFFLDGGIAVGKHYGEKITKLPDLKKLPIIIIHPAIKKISTQKIYGELDLSKTGRRRIDTQKLIRHLKNTNSSRSDMLLHLGALCHNDFDTAKSLQQNKILTLRKKLLRHAPLLVQSCGSGMAQMALYKSHHAKTKAHRELKRSRLFLWHA